jgi:hypothetical protein
MTANDLLKKTLDLIKDPENWCTGADYLDSKGMPVGFSVHARKMSLSGALRVTSYSEIDAYVEAVKELHKACANIRHQCTHPLVTLAGLSHSADTSHEIIVKVLKAAIEATNPRPTRFKVTSSYSETIEAENEADAIEKVKAKIVSITAFTATPI